MNELVNLSVSPSVATEQAANAIPQISALHIVNDSQIREEDESNLQAFSAASNESNLNLQNNPNSLLNGAIITANNVPQQIVEAYQVNDENNHSELFSANSQLEEMVRSAHTTAQSSHHLPQPTSIIPDPSNQNNSQLQRQSIDLQTPAYQAPTSVMHPTGFIQLQNLNDSLQLPNNALQPIYNAQQPLINSPPMFSSPPPLNNSPPEQLLNPAHLLNAPNHLLPYRAYSQIPLQQLGFPLAWASHQPPLMQAPAFHGIPSPPETLNSDATSTGEQYSGNASDQPMTHSFHIQDIPTPPYQPASSQQRPADSNLPYGWDKPGLLPTPNVPPLKRPLTTPNVSPLPSTNFNKYPAVPADDPDVNILLHGKIFVGALSQDTTSARLAAYFARDFGYVTECVIKDDAQGRSRGFGFISFYDHYQAWRVVKNGPYEVSVSLEKPVCLGLENAYIVWSKKVSH